MKSWMTWTMAMAAIVMVGLVAGCGDDDEVTEPPVATEFEMLSDYIEANNLDLQTLMSNWIVNAQDVFEAGLDNYFIIDVRKADKYGPGTLEPNGVPDFEDGHIPGAHSVALADVVTYEAANNTEGKPVIVVCYTGHSAAHGTMALRLMGVDAQSLKWGMSGWHSDFDLWTSNTGDVANDYPGCWSNDEVPDAPSYAERPNIETGFDDGADILEAQVEALLDGGLRGIGNTEVLESYEDYHIISYWGASDWDLYGQITGAYQVTPGELGLETLDVLDPDGTNVLYCWSGQTASMVAAWLTVMGYDAKTLKFSANGMIYSQLQSHKWTTGTPAGLIYETAATEFDILTDYLVDNGLDLPTMLQNWIINPQDVYDNGLNTYFIMDVRMGDKYGPGTIGANGVPDFEDGHIPGAHSVPLADVVTYEAANNTGNKPVIVVCYTGHDAGHGTMALRLTGVSDAKSLKWGMSGWHSDFDLWTRNTGDAALDHPGSWSYDDPPALPSFGHPNIDTGLTDGAAILEYQINNAVLDGLNGINNVDVLSDPAGYQIINYWARTDWDLYGQITGAYQVAPGDLSATNLEILDPAATNVFYCWSGQTASMVAAWLNVCGYDARTLKFSANGMIFNDLQSHKWPGSLDLEYDTGP